MSETSKSKHLLQNAIFIAVLFMVVPVWAKKIDHGIRQTTPESRNLGINSQQSARIHATRAECSTSDFTFDTLRAQPAGYGFTRITGRITNHCAEAKGAQIKITTYNRTGVILSDDAIWPAGITNIPANSEYPFEWIHTKAVFAKFTVTIISVKLWPEALARRFPSDHEPANVLTPSN
jgi:hypothetical protein